MIWRLLITLGALMLIGCSSDSTSKPPRAPSGDDPGDKVPNGTDGAGDTEGAGGMVSDGYRYLLSNPIISFAPGFAVMLLVFAFNMVGDGLRDALDPRLRGLL